VRVPDEGVEVAGRAQAGVDDAWPPSEDAVAYREPGSDDGVTYTLMTASWCNVPYGSDQRSTRYDHEPGRSALTVADQASSPISSTEPATWPLPAVHQ
jgi:hypothetical protein